MYGKDNCAFGVIMITALIIEDNRQMSDMLKQMLSLLDVSSMQAFTPKVALDLINRSIPQVIFLDIHLPGVDGFEVLSYLRREPRLIGVPVIVVTSDDQPQIKERAKQLGALDVMIKPVILDDLESIMKREKLI
jgi:CheY-like chemotaxis protein